MILAVPAETAVTKPADGSTVATELLLLLHDPVPPPRTTPFAVKVAVSPTQSGLLPLTELTAASGVTVKVAEAVGVPLQPPLMV